MTSVAGDPRGGLRRATRPGARPGSRPGSPPGPPRGRTPEATDAERRLRSPGVRLLRPFILGGVVLLRLVCRFGWSCVGAAHLRSHRPPLIFAANHQSHVDTAAILGTLPRAIRRRTCVAAALDVFGPAADGSRHPVRALRRECLRTIVAAGFHAFAFDRNGPPRPSLRAATELVGAGWSLLLYPEGTRSRTGELGPFKAGVGIVAKSTGRPVVPVHVAGGRAILPCGRTIPRPGHLVVRYGEPIEFEEGDTAASFTARLRERVRALAESPAPAARLRPASAGLAPLPPADARQPST